MLIRTRLLTAVWLVPTLLCVGLAQAETDSGQASVTPWSGFWWQHRSGGLTGPLGKYDQVFGSQSAGWEQSNHVATASADWFGHCHAWSASAVSEKEPQQVVARGGVQFGVGDQKGLLAALHSSDVANSYGDRMADGEGSEDPQDMSPELLWKVLQSYIKQKGIPIVLDLDAGDQVWNHPVYQYRVDFQNAGDGWVNGVMQIVAADDNVYPDFIGTQPKLQQYTFRLRFVEGAIQVGSGQWTGASVNDHPDFAWYPYVAVAENPYIQADQVAQLVGYSVGGGNAPPEVDPNAPPDVDGPNEPVTPPPVDPDNPPPPVDPNPDRPQPDPNRPAPVDVDDLLSADELVDLVANKTSHFDLDIFTDKGDGGKYAAGETIRISVKSGKEGYLYLFDVDPDGDIAMVFPRIGEPNFIRGGTLYDIPLEGFQPWFVAEEQGQHEIKGVVLDRPVQITGFVQVLPHQQTQRQTGKVPPKEKPAPTTPAQKPGQAPVQRAQVVPPTQRMWIHPAGRQRVRTRVLRWRKAVDEQPAAPAKLGAFAQDSCLYFVMGPAGKPQK